jgi:hypothetical protein
MVSPQVYCWQLFLYREPTMSKKRATTSKPKQPRVTGAVPDLQRKPVSRASSQNVRGGGINRIVVTDGKING